MAPDEASTMRAQRVHPDQMDSFDR